jgi:hypothetical protein
MRTHLLPLLVLLAATTAFLPGQDDRDRTTPAATYWAAGRSVADLNSLAGSGWRFTDLEIESTSPWTFTVAAVQNTGSYQKGWLWLYGATAAQVSAAISSNNARLVDLEPYDDNGTTRFAAILIGNTGVDQKAWWWGYGMTSAQLNSTVAANNARLTCFRRYTIGGSTFYAGVMIANTGADFRNWGYLYGATAAQINASVASGNRIYGIERVASDSFDVILIQASGVGHWYYFDQTATAVTELLQQNIGRIVDIERHTVPLLGSRYTVAMIDNANALERVARQEFLTAPPAALGKYGFFLKELNGPVLAQMRPDTTFEPASTMKTVYHAHVMRRVSLNLSSLSTMINRPSSCGVPGANYSIEDQLSDMMEYSNNMATLAISNHFSIPQIQAEAANLGMTSTSINFTIGCSGPSSESTMTLRDLSRLHEAVANGYLAGQRAKFYELMQESLLFPSFGVTRLDGLIDGEAATLGWPAHVRNAFKNALHLAYKPGGVGWPNPGQWTFYYAEGGWMKVPFKNAAGVVTPKEYTFGAFHYLFYGAANEIPGRVAMSDAELALVWDRVRAAMLTWDNYVPGVVTQLGAGCLGSNGTPLHTASPLPEIGVSTAYSVQNVPANALVVAVFGFQNTSWGGVPLPLDLGPAGAPGCVVRVDPAMLTPGVSFTNGSWGTWVGFPYDPALFGALLYSQYAAYDPAANTFGWTLSNALRSTVGGYR